MDAPPTAEQRVYDYLDHPPQRYDEPRRPSVNGKWVKFEDMDLYMLEGGELMKQMAAENDRLRAAETAEAQVTCRALDACTQEIHRLHAEISALRGLFADEGYEIGAFTGNGAPLFRRPGPCIP